MMLEGADYTEGFVRCLCEAYKPDWVDDFVAPVGASRFSMVKTTHRLWLCGVRWIRTGFRSCLS